MLSTAAVVIADLSAALSRPPGSDARRLRRVAKDPSTATAGDLELLVRAHGVPEQQVWAVVDRLAGGRVDPELAWRWTMDFDGNELAGLCASRLTDRELGSVLSGHRWALTGNLD